MVASHRYPVPAGEARAEVEILRSRFIASAGPAASVAEARGFVARIRREFADATHNVPAYLVGYGSSTVTHCHDDGEPAGTAGRPALAVLAGSGLGDVAVVVTRYFGGTKLGTGGLVRAYQGAVRAVLGILPRAERRPAHRVVVVSPYRDFEQARLLIGAFRGQTLQEEFGVDVAITARFTVEDLPDFQEALRKASAGRMEAVVVGSEVMFIPLCTRGFDCDKKT